MILKKGHNVNYVSIMFFTLGCKCANPKVNFLDQKSGQVKKWMTAKVV